MSLEQDENMTVEKAGSGKIFDRIHHRYDLLNHILSFGLDLRWRKILAGWALSDLMNINNPRILDLASGTGDMSIAIKRKIDSSEIVCMDVSANMLQHAENKINRKGMEGFDFIQGDASEMSLESSEFDAVTTSFGIRNFPSLEHSMEECLRVLKPGGSLYILEFGWPDNAAFSFLYSLYSKTVIPFLGWVIAGDKTAYNYLRRTIRVFPYGSSMVRILCSCGFRNIAYRKVAGGIVYLYSAYK
ncbi:MAG: ubiquinone/menaquinone biosynthesis methyltransferase [Bacteroidales bacterium]|nr:ubiquinone/menaquinone biosynthesis methyltransferase [Bacteroidales bacterium]